MNRRSFIGQILALGMAPAIVHGQNIMRVIPRGLSETVSGILYISSTFGDDANDGRSWAAAKRTLDGIGSLQDAQIYVADMRVEVAGIELNNCIFRFSEPKQLRVN